MNLLRSLQKHKYIRVISFNKDKSSDISYYKRGKLPKSIVVNSDHIFIANGYTTGVVKNHEGEFINPLDFKSAFDSEQFTTAINNSLMKELFASLKTPKLDLAMILSIVSIGLMLIMLYFQLKGQGIIK